MTRFNRYQGRLASKAHARQDDVVRRADAAADQAGAAVGSVWAEVLRLLRSRPHWGVAFHESARLFALLPWLPRLRTAEALGRMARWGFRSARADVVQALPARLLVRAVERRVNHAVVFESGDPQRRRTDRLGMDSLLHRVSVGDPQGLPLREDESTAAPTFTLTDLLALLRDSHTRVAGTHPRSAAAASAAAVKDLLEPFLFPAPTPEQIHQVIYASGWQERLAASTRLAAPETLAGLLAGGIALGKTPQQIARDLLPAVEGVRSTARRIARTEALRVAGVMQRACHEGLGDLHIGWELRATHDRWSRPWHARRDGRKYYFHPGPGQDGIDKCPFPPDEPDDPRERPAKAPKIAFNCR